MLRLCLQRPQGCTSGINELIKRNAFSAVYPVRFLSRLPWLSKITPLCFVTASRRFCCFLPAKSFSSLSLAATTALYCTKLFSHHSGFWMFFVCFCSTHLFTKAFAFYELGNWLFCSKCISQSVLKGWGCRSPSFWSSLNIFKESWRTTRIAVSTKLNWNCLQPIINTMVNTLFWVLRR